MDLFSQPPDAPASPTPPGGPPRPSGGPAAGDAASGSTAASPAAPDTTARAAPDAVSPGERAAGDPPADLTPAFRALDVAVAPGVTLIEASAGTGKTYALTELVLRLVLDPEAGQLDGPDGVDLRRLLVVTFTVAATEELKTRIRRALRLALAAFERGDTPEAAPALVRPFVERFERDASVRRLRRALAQSGEAGVFTIHGFCKRVLERSAFESGEPFAFDFTEDADRLRQRAARDVWHGLIAAHPTLGRIALASGWSLDRLLEHEALATRYADTAVVPPAPALDDALAAVEDARCALARVWDADEALTVVPPDFFSTNETTHGALAADRPGLFRRVAAFADGDTGQLDAVRRATTDAVTAAIGYKNRSGPKAAAEAACAYPGFLACDAVVEAVGTVELALVHTVVARVGAAYRTLKERSGVLTFDDLIDRLDRALAPGAPTRAALARSIQAQFAVALIDEFQDTDPKQYRIFRAAFEGRPLFFIGDPKQAIYAFRGADVFAYLAARRDARAAYTLGTNYRSAPRLVAAVNAVFGRLGPGGRPFVYEGIPFEPVVARDGAEPGLRGVAPAAPLVWWTPDGLATNRRGEISKQLARDAAQEATVTEIARLLNNPSVQVRDTDADGTARWRRLEAGDIAVLVRKNQQARDLQDALRYAGVPSVVGRGDDIRTSREMDELERVLRAVARPGDRRTVRAALATEMWGWTAADLAADADDVRLDAIVETLRRDRAVWRAHGVFRMLTGLLRREGIPDRLQGYADRERRLTNLRHAIELLHDVEATEGRSPDELLHWVRTRMSRSFAHGSAVEMRLESDAEAVQLVTMHNAKGLEYPVVFAPFVWDENEKELWRGPGFVERPPVAHTDGGARAVYDLGSDDQDRVRGLADAERLAESLRLTYVALTRARERLYLLWGPLSGAHMSGLGHLLRDLPLPTAESASAEAGGLAALDADTKKAAARALKGSLDTLTDWARGRPDEMAVTTLPTGWGVVEPRAVARAARSARGLSPALAERVARHAGTGSFSSWAAGVESDVRHDAPTADALSPSDGEPADAPETDLFAFAAGARAGICLHEILQYADFSAPDAFADPDSDASTQVARRLRLHGLHAAHPRTGRPHRAPLDPAGAVRATLAELARTPVPGFGFALADVSPDRAAQAAEWRFRAPRSDGAPSAIADLFEAYGDNALRAYAPALRALRGDLVEDLFTGIADLVVQHPAPAGEAPGGGFYLFDWKSNHLGPTRDHYGPEAIDRAMRAHHYYLQAHLYAVGLHRHLRARLGDAYDPEVHLGGVAYVFLRGISETTGWWTARPTPALIDALDALLFAPPTDAP